MNEVQQAKWRDIKIKRDTINNYGGIFVAGKWFDVDTPSRIKIMGAFLMGANIPPNIQWKTMDGTFVNMTQALAAQLFMAVVASDMTIFAVAEMHRTALMASLDPENYDISSGWPAVFGA